MDRTDPPEQGEPLGTSQQVPEAQQPQVHGDTQPPRTPERGDATRRGPRSPRGGRSPGSQQSPASGSGGSRTREYRTYAPPWEQFADAPFSPTEEMILRERQSRGALEERLIAVMERLADNNAPRTPKEETSSRRDDQFRAKFLMAPEVPAFTGHIGTTASEYKEWRKNLKVWQNIHKLTDQELASVLCTQLTWRAKDLLTFMEPEDLEAPEVLDWIWDIYDEQFLQESWIVLEKTESNWEKIQRKHGEPMTDYLMRFQKTLREKQIQDPSTVISEQAVASKMLKTCLLTEKESPRS